jgi:hypothetical protein
MQLQAVVDTAAQVTLVSEEFYKSLDPAPPIRKEVVMNTAGKKLMGITSPDICSSFSLRCRDTPLASKKSKPSNISSSIGAT